MPRTATDLFGKALLREAIDLVPTIPEGADIEAARAHVRASLHYNAHETRIRFSNYVIQRMFPTGRVDPELTTFARRYADRQEWRDVAYYRFCRAESLIPWIVMGLFLPAIGRGVVSRTEIAASLRDRYPSASDNTIQSCCQAVTDVLVHSNVAARTRTEMRIGYRPVLAASFAFVLHSEFPEAGMYNLADAFGRPAIRAMFWAPEHLESALYDLRNAGFIPKVSQIDGMRQFSTSLSLEQVVRKLEEVAP